MMLDVVANHAGPVGLDPSPVNPFNKPEHYHSCIEGCEPQTCSIPDSAYNDPPNVQLIQTCRVGHLPDLNQSVPYVQQELLGWLGKTLDEYGFDGLRLDTVKHVANVSRHLLDTQGLCVKEPSVILTRNLKQSCLMEEEEKQKKKQPPAACPLHYHHAAAYLTWLCMQCPGCTLAL